ncbi:hypothetical protein [Neisseria sp.]|uniref:hypothetical protein n=1 Tax=Neisseria sp. TaxID=192066 RepID=UPI0035A0190D
MTPIPFQTALQPENPCSRTGRLKNCSACKRLTPIPFQTALQPKNPCGNTGRLKTAT